MATLIITTKDAGTETVHCSSRTKALDAAIKAEKRKDVVATRILSR